MACDDEVLPLKARVEAVADEVELDDVYETERQLFYVACTRARDRLMVSGSILRQNFLMIWDRRWGLRRWQFPSASMERDTSDVFRDTD